MEATPRDDANTPEAAPTGAASRKPSKVHFEPVRFEPVRFESVRFEPASIGRQGLRRVARLRDEFVAASQRASQAEADRARALAQMQELTIEQAHSDAEISLTLRSRAAECAAALGLSERAVLGQMAEAHTLVYAFPATIAAVTAATITMQHAKAVVTEGSGVSDRLRETYEARCLEVAVQASVGRLRTQARLIAQELQPRTIDELHVVAAAQRCVWVRELPDGMAELGAILPAVLAFGIRDRVQNIAKAVKQQVAREGAAQSLSEKFPPDNITGGSTVADGLGISIAPPTELPANYGRLKPEEQEEARAKVERFRDARDQWTLDTYRADVFAELLLTGVLAASEQSTMTQQVAPGIQANISISIPVGGTATLDGYGPIDAATARQFAEVAPGWDCTIVGADGEVLATDRRQPTEAMKRILRARDLHCRFPGCVVPTRSCEIDHTIEWAAGGKTEIPNLGHLCPKHHLLKHPDLAHQIQWRVRQDSGGVYVWTSPTGAEYTDRPDLTPREKSGTAARSSRGIALRDPRDAHGSTQLSR